jgi:homoserine dehydrogenase
MFSGRGAGPEPTASAILSDLMALASGKADGGLQREMRLALPQQPKKIRPMADLETCFYIRFGLADVAGALGRVFNILGKCAINVSSMIQPAEHVADHAHVIVVTHTAREAAVQNALKEIKALDDSRGRPFVLRIEEMG